MWKLVSFCLEIALMLTQDRCTVCAERTIGSKWFWMHPMELLGDVGLVECQVTWDMWNLILAVWRQC